MQNIVMHIFLIHNFSIRVLFICIIIENYFNYLEIDVFKDITHDNLTESQ